MRPSANIGGRLQIGPGLLAGIMTDKCKWEAVSKMQSVKGVETQEKCPQCQRPLVVRYSKKTGSKFLGCSGMYEGADVQPFTPEAGDRLLLASDGLTNHVEDDDLREGARRYPDPQAWADHLVQTALDHWATISRATSAGRRYVGLFCLEEEL